MNYTLILTGIAMLCCVHLQAQKRWSGAGDNAQWAMPANWAGNSLPSSTDDVLLDNFYRAGSYSVTLPANTTVAVKTIRIAPLPGNTIQLTIPSANTTSPAFKTTGSGYTVIIDNGGIFKNSSGLASGTSLSVADSIRINNGGTYIHNTRTAHAATIVAGLSKAPGTEDGTFEFDIPAGSGTLSLSGRTYGNLVLSAAAAGASRTYTASGSNTLTINGSLLVKPGVTLSMDLASVNGNVIIKRDLQNKGTLNLASGAGDSSIFKIGGTIAQEATGLLTETSTGSPSIELNGTMPQSIAIYGAITGDVRFVINNPAGAVLLAPLSLPHKLLLQRGQLTTSATAMLTLQRDCSLLADSVSSTSFVNGPLKKAGLSAASRFLFPVGKSNMQRWLELKNATGDFTVEYMRSDPHLVNLVTEERIAHISSLEYWTVKAAALPAPSAGIKLSFDNNGSGGVTHLPALLVARLVNNLWTSLGNSGTTGTAGTNGSVTATNSIADFNTMNQDFFTLATDIGYGNPLPLKKAAVPPAREATRNGLLTRLLPFSPDVLQSNTAMLTVMAARGGQLYLIITNQLGQIISRQSFAVAHGDNKLMINTQSFPPGIYQVMGYIGGESTNTIRGIK